jgi:hypothetical protein
LSKKKITNININEQFCFKKVSERERDLPCNQAAGFVGGMDTSTEAAGNTFAAGDVVGVGNICVDVVVGTGPTVARVAATPDDTEELTDADVVVVVEVDEVDAIVA